MPQRAFRCYPSRGAITAKRSSRKAPKHHRQSLFSGMRTSHYRRYTTGLKQQYCAGILPAQVTSCIPRSTKNYWVKISQSQFFLPAGYTESQQAIALELLILRHENTALKTRLKALLYLLAIYKTITQQFTIHKQHIGGIYQLLTRALQYAAVHMPQYNPWQQLPFSYKQWLAYTGKPLCSLSAIALCRRQHPLQLSLQEQRNIASGCAEQRFANWLLASVYYQLLREQNVHCSLSTFYKYCRLMNIAAIRVKKPVKRTSLKAAGPLKILHMDITLFTTANGVRHYIYGHHR